MMEILLLLFVIALGIAVIGAAVYHGTRRGEDCRKENPVKRVKEQGRQAL